MGQIFVKYWREFVPKRRDSYGSGVIGISNEVTEGWSSVRVEEEHVE